MNLKTLKDIKRWPMNDEDIYDIGRGRFFRDFVSRDELRKEIIEWVKKYEPHLKEYKLIRIPVMINFNEWKYVEIDKVTIDWIKYFFNITEDDLN